jgi:hypothetical protein
MVYLGATEEQIAAHRSALGQTGQGSSHIRLLPNRKNLLKIDRESYSRKQANRILRLRLRESDGSSARAFRSSRSNAQLIARKEQVLCASVAAIQL